MSYIFGQYVLLLTQSRIALHFWPHIPLTIGNTLLAMDQLLARSVVVLFRVTNAAFFLESEENPLCPHPRELFQGPPQCGSGSEQPLSSYLEKWSAMDLLPVSPNSSLTRHPHPRICQSSCSAEEIPEAAGPLLPPYWQGDTSHRNSLLHREKWIKLPTGKDPTPECSMLSICTAA